MGLKSRVRRHLGTSSIGFLVKFEGWARGPTMYTYLPPIILQKLLSDILLSDKYNGLAIHQVLESLHQVAADTLLYE